MTRRLDIVHVMNWDKFVPSFIHFVEENFPDFEGHLFLILGKDDNYRIQRKNNTLFAHELRKLPRIIEISRAMNSARKIIFHGLFDVKILRLLTLQPWVLQKSYWAIWGGDLYGRVHPERMWGLISNEVFRKFVLKRMGHLLTYLQGDVDLARRRYGARGQHHSCLLYPSNLYQDHPAPQKGDRAINIQVGNSADPGNQHFEVLEMLAGLRSADIRIYAPLSYGDPEYARKVLDLGGRLFGRAFIGITRFLPFEEYLEFLGKIDIAIFNHRRQQAMGNTIALLGLGKKVFLRREVAQWKLFHEIGLKVFSVDEFDFDLLNDEQKQRNRTIVKEYFSKDKMIRQYAEIFE